MRTTERAILRWLLAAALALSVGIGAQGLTKDVAFATAQEGHAPSQVTAQEENQSIQTEISVVYKGTRPLLAVSGAEMEAAGFQIGDVLRLTWNAKDYIFPYVTDYQDVPFRAEAIANRGGTVLLFTNGGSIVSEYPDLEAGTKITIAMETPGGYLKEYNALHLDQYSVKRKDFPQLDWKQYANFRMVATSGIREGVLYRSSSPVNPKYNRNIYADEAIRSTRVKTVINMSDTTSDLDGFVGYDDSYYKTVNHVELGMESNYGDEDFNKKLAEGVRFMIAHPGPYMIHCIEGKERVGFMLAILESLMGASYTEVRQDFLISHYNYYGIKPDSERARVIADGTLREQLKYVFGKDPAKADLAKEANNYLRKTGLSASEITRLKTCLARYKNTMSVTKSVRTVKAARLKKSAVTVKPFQVKLPKGKVTYKKLSGSKYLTLNKSTGKITVKKKTRKGTYKIKVRVTAAGNGLYQKMDKDITVVVKVRKK